MSNVVYVVLEEDGSYEDRTQEVVGVFTDLDEARECVSADRTIRDIQTWSVGGESAHQRITLHIAKRVIANPNFDVFTEVRWKTEHQHTEVDASEPLDRYDYESNYELRRSGRTQEEADQRLNEALVDYKPDLTPTPREFRIPKPTWRYVEHFKF